MEDKMMDIKIAVKIDTVELIGLEIADAGRALKSPPSYDEYEFRFEIRPVTDLPNEKIHMNLKVFINNIKSKEVYGTFSVSFTFITTGIKAAFVPKDNFVHLDIRLLRTLAGICVSTARGLLITALANTKINNALVPIIDPNIFFTENPPIIELMENTPVSMTKLKSKTKPKSKTAPL